MKTELYDPNGYFDNPYPMISVTWHNRLLFFPAMSPVKDRKKTVAVISPSRDGQYVVDLLKFFGIKSARGSSSRRGGRVLREAVFALENNYCVGFTPDGPRGPKYKMSKGPIYLAGITGKKIIPVAVNASDYWELKSWDNFQIPKPWAKLTMIMGDPISIPANIDDDELEFYRQEVENKLLEISCCNEVCD